MLGQVGGDCVDRVAHPRVVGREEAEERDQQQRGVEGVGVVVLAKDAVADAALEDLGLELIRPLLPLRGQLVESPRRARRAPRSTATQIISFEET